MTGDEEQNELVHQLGDCTACNVAAGCSGKQSGLRNLEMQMLVFYSTMAPGDDTYKSRN